MNETVVEVGASMQDLGANPHLPPPPPTTQRRPRVREVSSRFMSPVTSSPSSSPVPSNKQQRSSSVQKQLQTEPFEENRLTVTDLTRSPPQRKQRGTVMKLFKENSGGGRQDLATPRSHRPDTPIVTAISSSKLRLIQQRSSPTISAAAKLLQSTGMSSSSHMENPSSNESSHDTSSDHHLRSSMPEGTVVASRYLADRNGNRLSGGSAVDSSKFSAASPCSRSLDLTRSSPSEFSLIHSLKAAEKTAKQHANFVKIGGPPLPPKPVATDLSKKGRKISNQQEDVHSLRLFHNHYLQWRYVNAKAEASIKAQRSETERTLYSLAVKIADLNESVKRKRIELGLLQKTKVLSTILEVQLPCLEDWSTLEENYSASLLEAIQALSNASIRLPICGNVRADERDVGESLNSAMKLMDLIALNVQSFMPKAEELEILISALTRVSGGEKALVEECGDLLSLTYRSQVEECSLLAQLIQLNQICGG